MSSSINILYSKDSFEFFTKIDALKKIIKDFQNNSKYTELEADHDSTQEIARADSYAFWDDLKDLVNKKHQPLTIEAFRASLEKQGIIDINFQNKILMIVLQNKLGLQYMIATLYNQLFINFLPNFSLDDIKTSLQIPYQNQLIMDFKAHIIKSIDEKTPLASVHVRLIITPETVSIADFTFKKLSTDEKADDFFSYLESHQHHFLYRLLLWIKRFFGFDDELCLEKSLRP